MIEPPRSRLPQILAVSIALHLVLGFTLSRIPASRDLLRRIIPIRLIERKKPPKPPTHRPAPKPKAKSAAPKVAAKPHPVPHNAPISSAPGPGFGLDVGSAVGGTMEVPIGNSLEATGSPGVPPPLVLEVADEAGTPGIERTPSPIGDLRVVYPDLARLAGMTGSAVVQAYVEADGRVTRAELVSSTASYFGRSALEAVRQSRFHAARRLGVAVACSIRIPIRFELNAVKVLASEPVDEAPELVQATSSVPLELPLATGSAATDSLPATASVPGGTP